MGIVIKRVYEGAEVADGYRVLIDRLWPRGVTKERAQLAEWLKDAAPSPELRSWWQHDPERMVGFAERYRSELLGNEETAAAAARLRALAAAHPRLTLVYAARDPAVNHALVLRDFLLRRSIP